MGMNIKSDEAQRIAKEIAHHTGETITSAVLTALKERLERLKREANYEERKARIEEIIRRSGPTAPGVTSDHSDLYDEYGLPK
ncbi:MAG TPA: type II toxin-antitoxin system VapB family antitoxin [Rhizobiaceae bacterium]|nr:type II toxin-antitoxin system VapB family antitoxin [Rhizobiaceae bacterium]